MTERSTTRRVISECVQVIKVARPGFWPTHLWFYVLPLATREMFHSPAFWLGCTYVCFPLGLLLYGWNDLGDVASDSINDRKDSWLFGARPDATIRRHLPAWIAAVQVPFVIAMCWLGGAKMLLWFAGVVLVNWTYNTLRFKSKPVLDLLNQSGYLLIFVLASWLCGVPQINAAAMVFSMLFAMQSHLFGQLMDLDADLAAGRRSTAVMIGAIPAKLLLVAIMLCEVAIAAAFFRSPIVAWFMACGATFFALDTAFGPKRYPVWFTKAFFVLWNLIVIVTMHWVWQYGLFLLD
ncbi:UbiA family prenyltransferase [Stieleria varia]|uniref:Prenyltransferase n=1 Tax=Stieleria varia TaxID=2528005 RepID=A0A5C5ZZR0_9BACT|nr:UbiA family prenyltransferase [Stieleria varia]TWT92438.1 prenyltransferase [Stieleria varia]